MSLRLRLIVAFFFLSVVPLAAVTLYTYASNAAALREAAGHEAQSLAGDLVAADAAGDDPDQRAGRACDGRAA